MWVSILCFILIIIILIFTYPFLIKFEIKFNILRLKGIVKIVILNKLIFEFKVRIKNGYIYINHKNKERKEKLSTNNVNLIFVMAMINETYFREQLLNFDMKANFGYNLDACVTAVVSGYVDVITKCILTKIKNNKKSAHIFVFVEPKYNQDVCSFSVTNNMRISIFDLVFSLAYAHYSSWGKKYEKV